MSEEHAGSAAPDRTAQRARMVLWLALLTAATLGLSASLELQASPFGARPVLDEQSYLQWASAVADGAVLRPRAFYQDPLYPYWLALLMGPFGVGLLGVRLVQVGFLVLGVGATAALGRQLFSPWVGALAAALVALYGPAYLDAASIGKESLLLAVAAGTWWQMAKAADAAGRWRWGLVGLLLGALSLMRGNFLALLPLVALAAAWCTTGRRARVIAFALVLGGAALGIAPATVHNALASKELVPTTWGAGPVFYLGNGPYADGAYPRVPFVRPTPLFEGDDFAAEAERRVGAPLGPAGVSRFWAGETLRFIAQEPGRTFALWLKKWSLLLRAHEVAGNYALGPMRERFLPALWFSFLDFGWLLGPALAGVLLVARRRESRAAPRGLVLTIGLGLAYLVAVSFFFVLGRYRLPVLPVLAVLAAAALVEAAQALREKRFVLVAVAVLGALAVAGLQRLPSSGDDDRLELAQCLGLAGVTLADLGKPQDAAELLTEAVGLAPQDSELWYGLGVARGAVGQPAEAEAAYVKALALSPDHRQALFNLGLLELQSHRASAAVGHLGRARALALPGPGVWLAEAAALEELGEAGRALALYDAALAAFPKAPLPLERALGLAVKVGDCARTRRFSAAVTASGQVLPVELERAAFAQCPVEPVKEPAP